MDKQQSDAELLDRIGIDTLEKIERQKQQKSFRTAFLFMSPAVFFVSVVLLSPVFANVYFSFTKWRKFKGIDQFAGMRNYEKLSSSLYFNEALINTIIWVIASISLPLIIGFALAVLLRNAPGENLFKNIIFIPRILAPTAVGVFWFYVYAPDGIVNQFLSLFTTAPVDIGWLYQDNTITGAIITTFVWQSVGLVMVLILLGLSALPKDPLEAATMDGASRLQTFLYITLPLLLPTLLVVTILSVLAGFTAFDLLWVMGLSYPGQRTLSLTVYMYFEAFQKGSWAFGSTLAIVIGLVVLSVTWLQTLLQSKIDRMMK